MSPVTLDGPDALDFAAVVRPGDTVVWGQACAEPVTLTERLMAQRAAIGPFRCFVGIPVTRTTGPEHADLVSFVSYCGTGRNRDLARAGALDVVPVHYSALPRLLSRGGAMPADVVLLLLPPPDPAGRYSLGLASDYVSAAIATARVVVAEVSDQVPRTGGPVLDPGHVDIVVRTSRAPAPYAARPAGDVLRQVARHAAGLIEDGATLQFGIGAVPEAVLAELSGHRDLGVHSGLLTDAAADLMEAGVVTNARKSVDRGQAVAGFLMGTRRLFRFADRNPAVVVRETGYTHDPDVLAAQDRLAAINSAIEVDLSGQVNAEVVGGEYVGAVGGAGDFLRGAARSRGGLPIVALPSTAGTSSRIVAELSGPVSTARADAGLIVTEFGVADLRGQPLGVRRERMLAIAHPEHRRQLEEAIDGQRPPGTVVSFLD